MHQENIYTSHSLHDFIFSSFSVQMLPWGIIVALACGVIGYLYRGLRLNEGLLRKSKKDLERKVEIRTEKLLKANQELRGEIIQRKKAEDGLIKQARIVTLGAEIGSALVQSKDLESLLQLCTESIVKHLDAAFARIWTLNEKENNLELMASAGIYTHKNGNHGSIPVGKFKIGIIAQNKKPHLTNEVMGDPQVSDQEWAKREGMIAFAGYPLVVADKLVGVMAMFAKKALHGNDLKALASISDEIALGIERKKAEEEKTKLEDQLRQAQKMESVGRLAGGVAHDYNNALSVIMGFTQLAMDEVDPTAPLHADLEEVLKAASRAADITRQLLAFARKQTIVPMVLDLNKNVKSMLKMLQHLIGEDLSLVWLPGADLWPVKMDPSQLDQILANLFVNARDAIAGVGKLTIETDMVTFDTAYCADHHGFIPGEFVMLSVSDNGCGMDKEILANIFEPFFTTKSPDKGTGLGLSTVYGIMKQNNGFINVYSEPGVGTTIKIYLPRHVGDAVDIQRESTEEIPPGHGETVLVVEDDPSILKLAQRVLEELGYIVLTANRPKEAIELVKEHTGGIHLLVTDVIMPEMNGLELANSLQSLCPDLKRVFMSGYTSNTIVHHGVLDEGVHFVQKPFSKRDLGNAVRKALDEVTSSVQG